MGEERIEALLQESLSVAVKTGAMKPQDTRRVIADTTVQPKNVTFPNDAKLVHRARKRLVTLAKKVGVDLRQSYVRVGKRALIQHQRYAHAKQFKRANRSFHTLKTYLGAPSGTSPAGSPAKRICRRSSSASSIWPDGGSSRSSASAVPRSTPCTRRRWRASAISRTSTVWAATTSPTLRATRQTPSSPPPDTTSPSSSSGSGICCA